mmetsp:Transcript_975/g.1555  ORF Transcript_975/g.1555 Transcript_975/m.1555 type:complete len:116 (-) Transcript_975:1154-1501(-)
MLERCDRIQPAVLLGGRGFRDSPRAHALQHNGQIAIVLVAALLLQSRCTMNPFFDVPPSTVFIIRTVDEWGVGLLPTFCKTEIPFHNHPFFPLLNVSDIPCKEIKKASQLPLVDD